jgi:hypothetical protein
MIARAKGADTELVVRAPKINVHKITLSATRRYDFFIPLTVEVNRAEIRDIFDKVDLDHSGSITVPEMRELLEKSYASNAAEAQQTENYIHREARWINVLKREGRVECWRFIFIAQVLPAPIECLNTRASSTVLGLGASPMRFAALLRHIFACVFGASAHVLGETYRTPPKPPLTYPARV